MIVVLSAFTALTTWAVVTKARKDRVADPAHLSIEIKPISPDQVKAADPVPSDVIKAMAMVKTVQAQPLTNGVEVDAQAHIFNREIGTHVYVWQLKISLAGKPDKVVWQKLYREQPFRLETQVYKPTFKEFAELLPGNYQAEVSLLTFDDGQPGMGARKTVDVSVQ
jgi:hypothetical protein